MSDAKTILPTNENRMTDESSTPAPEQLQRFAAALFVNQGVGLREGRVASKARDRTGAKP